MAKVEGLSSERLKAKVAEHGLVVRSVFHLDADDPLQPAVYDGSHIKPAAIIILIGNVASSLWPVFSQSAEYHDGKPDPLDRWSQRIGTCLASELNADVLFPFGGPPHYPFLSWAKRGEQGFTSPLGLTLNPEYGLWHAYRFALMFSESQELAGSSNDQPHIVDAVGPCQSCADKPCLNRCPVNAFSKQGYKVADCVRFLLQNPEHACNLKGCIARRACPVGRKHQYAAAHAQFHMQQFVSQYRESI